MFEKDHRTGNRNDNNEDPSFRYAMIGLGIIAAILWIAAIISYVIYPPKW